MSDFNSVESRAEDILARMIDGEPIEDFKPMSRLEELLLMLNDSIKNNHGSGGVTLDDVSQLIDEKVSQSSQNNQTAAYDLSFDYDPSSVFGVLLNHNTGLPMKFSEILDDIAACKNICLLIEGASLCSSVTFYKASNNRIEFAGIAQPYYSSHSLESLLIITGVLTSSDSPGRLYSSDTKIIRF